jgi:YfiH family protein
MSSPLAQSPALAALPGIVHGFFGRRGGASVGDFASLNMSTSVGDAAQNVAGNRAAIAGALGMRPERLVILRQVHSARAVNLSVATAPGAIEADGVVSAARGLLLGILTADCAPVLLADREAGVVGAFHAGWRGALDGIAASTVAAMQALGAEPARIVAAIGPTISLANYEVGPDFTANLLALHRDAGNRIATPEGGREHFDLPGFVFDQLVAAGVGLVNDLGLCTYAAPRHYFSHRYATHKGTRTGRQIAVIGLS